MVFHYGRKVVDQVRLNLANMDNFYNFFIFSFFFPFFYFFIVASNPRQSSEARPHHRLDWQGSSLTNHGRGSTSHDPARSCLGQHRQGRPSLEARRSKATRQRPRRLTIVAFAEARPHPLHRGRPHQRPWGLTFVVFDLAGLGLPWVGWGMTTPPTM